MDVPPEAPLALRLHDFEPEPQRPRATYRLFAQGRPVGLAKRAGEGFFYSTDGGYAWTGKKIDADQWAVESSLRDRGDRRIYNGDEVWLASGGSTRRKRVVVVDGRGGTWLYDLQGRRLEPVPFTQARNLWSGLSLIERHNPNKWTTLDAINAALSTQHLARAWSVQDVASLSITFLLSLAMAAALAHGVDSGVSLVVPFVVAALGAWAWHRWQLRGASTWFSRPAMLVLSQRVGAVCALVLTLMWCAVSRWGGEGAILGAQPWWMMPLVLCGMVLLCTLLVVLPGDLAVWQVKGGYPGEGPRR